MATTYSVSIEFKAKGGQALQQVTRQAEDLKRTVDGTKLEVLNTALGVLPGRAGAAANGIVGLTRGLKEAQTQARATAVQIEVLQAALAKKNLELGTKKGLGAEKIKKEIAVIEDSIAGLSKGSGAGAMALGAIGIAAVGVAAALGGLVASSVRFNDELGRNRQQLTLFTKSAQTTDEIVKSLQKTADETALGLPGLLEATKTLAAYGVEAKNAQAATKLLGDVAMGDNEKLQRFAVNLGQIKSLGKAYTVDLKQFAQAGVPIFQALADVTGKSTSEIMKMAEEGKISYALVIKALLAITKEGQSFYDGAKKGGTEMGIAFQQMQGSWEKLLVIIGQAATPTVVATFNAIADALTNVNKAVEGTGKAFDYLSKGPLHGAANQIAWLTKKYDEFLDKHKEVALAQAWVQGGPIGALKEGYNQYNKGEKEKDKGKTSDKDLLKEKAEERRQLEETARKDSLENAKAEQAKLDQEIANKKKKINIDTERSLADARLNYEQQIADFRKQQIQSIADLERQINDERTKKQFDNSQGESRVKSLNRQIASNIAIAQAAGRGENTSGMQAARDAQQRFDQLERDRQEIEFNTAQRRVQNERRLTDFKIQTEKQLGTMQTAYARQTDSILRGAAQKIGDLMIDGATKAKQILESAQMGGGGGGNKPSAGGGAAIASAANANEKKWLQLLRYAEGTDGPDGYRTLYGGGKFTDMSRHPDKVVTAGGRRSAAAGAYQFLPGTWKETGIPGYSPAEQDRGARMLAKRYGVDILKDPINEKNISKLGRAWSSLPTDGGGSFYGQPSKTVQDLLSRFGPSAPTKSGSGAKDGYISKEVLRKWLISQGMGRTSGDFTNKGHQTPNHMLNAMDMGFTDSKYDHNYVQKAKEMEAKLRATGAFGDQLFGPTRDPKGHKDHLHIPTPGGMVRNTPGLQALMSGQQLPIGAANNIVPFGNIPTDSPGLRKANAGLNADDSKGGQIQELNAQQQLVDKLAARYAEIATDQQASLQAVTDKNKIDQATLSLMQTGIKPELAAQLANNQQIVAAKTATLEQQKLEAIQGLEIKGITEKTREDYEAILAAINGQIEAQPQLLENLDAEAAKTQQIADARASWQEGKDQAKSDAQGVSSTITGGIKEAIKAAVTGGDVKAALSNMLSSLGDKFLDMAMRPLEKMLTDYFMKIFDPGTVATVANTAALTMLNTTIAAQIASQGVGGALGGIGKALLGGLFGGAGGGLGAVGSFGSAMSPTTWLPSFLAVGGPAQAGSPYIVGEKGPELFVPNTGGSVLPADRTAAMDRYQRQSGNSGGQGGEFGQSTDISPAAWQMNFETTQILGQDWVSKDQLLAAMAETEQRATKAGAKAGASQVAQKMRGSPSFRKQVGM